MSDPHVYEVFWAPILGSTKNLQVRAKTEVDQAEGICGAEELNPTFVSDAHACRCCKWVAVKELTL